MEQKEKNTILIVDDDKANLLELTHILQAEYKIFAAKSGEVALERAISSKPDLILLDIVMPGISGFEVLTELKNTEGTKDIPVIFISGISKDNTESVGIIMGATDHIRKPFDAAGVKARVKHQMDIINLKRGLNKAVEIINSVHEIAVNMSKRTDLPTHVSDDMNAILQACEELGG